MNWWKIKTQVTVFTLFRNKGRKVSTIVFIYISKPTVSRDFCRPLFRYCQIVLGLGKEKSSSGLILGQII
jgi:hypothetical protein